MKVSKNEIKAKKIVNVLIRIPAFRVLHSLAHLSLLRQKKASYYIT